MKIVSLSLYVGTVKEGEEKRKVKKEANDKEDRREVKKEDERKVGAVHWEGEGCPGGKGKEEG